MARAITKGHIKLNGQEYLIDETSYEVNETPDLAPRINSGTPGYQDHLVFKNDAQSLWNGGYDFPYPDDFQNPTTFLSSSNIDVFNKLGQFTLARRLDPAFISLLQSGSLYKTNTKAGFDAGTFTQAESTDTPDIRVSFDSAASVYTTKETFAGGGVDAEFTQQTSGGGTIDESGGYGRLRVKSNQIAALKGTTTTIKGFKATSIGRDTGTRAGYSSFWVGLTDTEHNDFNGSNKPSGNYVILHWLNDVNELELYVGGSSYGTYYERFSGNSVTFEVKEVNGNKIEIYVDSVLKTTINAAVATGSFFKMFAYQTIDDTEMILKADQIDYWNYGYYTTGNWRSATYTNTGSATDNIVELYLEHSGLSATNYIDKIEVLDASNNAVLSTYATNIESGTSSTFTGTLVEGWDVAFSDAAFDAKSVKVKIYFVTNGGIITPKVSLVRVTFSSTGSVQSIDTMQPWNSDLYFAGAKQLWKTSGGTSPTASKQATAISAITDLEAFAGRLYAAIGAGGYQFTATGAALTGRTTFTPDYLTKNETAATSGTQGRLYGVDDNVLKYSENPENSSPTWTTAFTHRSSAGETFFLGKPVVHNRYIYYTVNRGDTTDGPGGLWLYDHNNGIAIEVKRFESPISKKMISFNGRLLFAVKEKKSLVIKALDGGSILTLKKIEDADATFNEPIEWIEYEGCIYMTVKSSSTSSYLYQYNPQYDKGNGEGWVRLQTLTSSQASAYYRLGILDRELYIGDDQGNLAKVSTNYYASGNLVSSTFDAGQFKIKKKYLELEIFHDALPANTTITVSYKLDNDTSYTSLEGQSGAVNSTSFIAKFPTSNNVGKALTVKITLTSAAGTTSPTVKDAIIRYQFVEEFKKQWQFGVIITDSIEYLDGSREQKSSADLLGTLQSARLATDSGTIDFYDLDETLHKIDYMRFGAQVPKIVGDDAKQDYLVGVQLIETQTTTT